MEGRKEKKIKNRFSDVEILVYSEKKILGNTNDRVKGEDDGAIHWINFGCRVCNIKIIKTEIGKSKIR